MDENIKNVIRSIVVEELCNDNLNVLLTSVENTVTSSGLNSFNDDTEFNDEHEEDHFFRVTIPKYSLIDFKKQFRISKGLFDVNINSLCYVFLFLVKLNKIFVLIFRFFFKKLTIY